MSLTRTLADFIAGASAGDLSPAVLHAASRCLLDFTGNVLGGNYHASLDILLRVIAGLQSAPQATVLGRGARCSVLDAALANGLLAHVLDFDDTLTDTVLHGTAPVMPAVLALAERDGRSGSEVALAFVLGFEVEARLAEAI